MPSKKIDPKILEELLNESRDQDYGELVAAIEAEPEEKPLEELIRNAYRDNELAKDMLAALHEQESCEDTAGQSRSGRCSAVISPSAQ